MGLHRSMRDGCLYAIRKVCGDISRDCGFIVGNDFNSSSIKEIRVPCLIRRNGVVVSRMAGECQDGFEFYEEAFAQWFPGVMVRDTNTNEVCRGSGDPFAVMDESFVQSLPDWRLLVYEFAYSHAQ